MTWKEVWRTGLAPQFSTEALESLSEALRTDNPQLMQGATSSPPPLNCVQDWTCEGACPISWGAYIEGCTTVGEVEEWFANACFKCDQIMGEPASCRYFIGWVDDTPRDRMRKELLEEATREISLRLFSQGVA